jgi:hypothetical protein
MRRNQRRALGLVCYSLGWLPAPATALFAKSGLAGSNLPDLAYVAIFVGVLAVTLFLFGAAERFFVPSVRNALARDTRPPVVYLRAFGEDKELVYDETVTTEGIVVADTAKAEDFLLSLNAIGPLVSIAEPTSRARLGMHPLGAYRDFVDPGDWKARVRELLDQAGMVVLAIGDSPGIEWEIAQARERVGPESLLLYLPPRPARAFTRKGRAEKERAVYDAFKPLVERHFDLEMPPFSKAIHIIGFDAAGKPVLPMQTPRSTGFFGERHRVRKAIRAQLAEVLGKLRPEVDLRYYELLGQPGRWIRAALPLAVVVSLIMTDGSNTLFTIGSTLWGVMTITGWVLLARFFQRPWVWSIPVLLGLSWSLNLAFPWLLSFGESYGLSIFDLARLRSVLSWIVNFAMAVAILMLGMAMRGKRSVTTPGVPPRV